MSLFKQLSTVLDNQELTLHIKKSDEKLIVTVLPKPKVKDEAKELLIPLVLKGTPEEIDEGLAKAIAVCESIDQTSNNLAEFEKSKKKFEEENKAKKEIADKKKKEVEKAEKELEKVDEYIKNKDFDKAEFIINNVLKVDDKNKKALAKKEELEKAKPQQVSMFDIIEEEEEKNVANVETDEEYNARVAEIEGEPEDNEDDNEEAQANYEEHLNQELDDEMELLEELQEEETDEDIKEQLFNFDIQAKAADDFDPFEEEREYWAKREYEKQQQQQVPSFIKR